jgi:uncharacterized membrane protein HdeD (DUF308 family)
MLEQLLKKWWVILLQGVLLIMLSFYIFSNPAPVLAGISFWFGLLVFAAGLLGIIGWFVADKSEKDSMSLIWSILTAVFGSQMLLHLIATTKVITVFFGVWVLVSGILLLINAWSLGKNPISWVAAITGILSVIAAVMMIFNIGLGMIAVSTLLGLQVLVTGIDLVLLSITKKTVMVKAKDKIEALA